MGTHAGILVVNEDTTQAVYGYEHYDGQCAIDDLLEFATARNKVNAWQARGHDDELWPVTPAEFISRWAEERRADHIRFGRTGSGVSTTLEGVNPSNALAAEFTHYVVVDGIQVRSIRRTHNALYGHGASYTITFDPAPVTDGTERDVERPHQQHS